MCDIQVAMKTVVGKFLMFVTAVVQSFFQYYDMAQEL